MQDLTMEELAEKVVVQKEWQKAYMRDYMRERYQFAKSLGFSATEASILSTRGKDTIRRLAQERSE